jgi:hypothetical protein
MQECKAVIRSKTRLVLACRCVSTGLAVASVILAYGCFREERPVAVYEGFKVQSSPQFTTLMASSDEGPVNACVFVQLPNGDRYLLGDLPEDVISRLLPKADVGEPEKLFGDYYSTFDYYDGKLFVAILGSGSHLFRISSRREGPYLSFPIEREALLRVFGEPLRWRPRPPSNVVP